jgi:hypothetical protein
MRRPKPARLSTCKCISCQDDEVRGTTGAPIRGATPVAESGSPSATLPKAQKHPASSRSGSPTQKFYGDDQSNAQSTENKRDLVREAESIPIYSKKPVYCLPPWIAGSFHRKTTDAKLRFFLCNLPRDQKLLADRRSHRVSYCDPQSAVRNKSLDSDPRSAESVSRKSASRPSPRSAC